MASSATAVAGGAVMTFGLPRYRVSLRHGIDGDAYTVQLYRWLGWEDVAEYHFAPYPTYGYRTEAEARRLAEEMFRLLEDA